MFSFFSRNPPLLQTLRDYIERKLTLPSECQYAYTVISKKDPSKFLIISNYPNEWVELYKRNNFQFVDPVILKGLKQSLPFAWDENITLLSDINFNKIFSLSRQYNILNGFTFVLHDHHNNLSLLSIIPDTNSNDKSETQPISEKSIMQMHLIEFNAQMYKLVESASTGSLYVRASPTKTIFTQREHEVLYWASMGKTYPEIASILGISVSTIKFHMGNVVNKLQVANARQAIRLGITMDLIKPIASAAR